MTDLPRLAGPWLGLDVGGANVKAAHESGATLTRAFPLWRRPSDLPHVLDEMVRRLPPAGGLSR